MPTMPDGAEIVLVKSGHDWIGTTSADGVVIETTGFEPMTVAGQVEAKWLDKRFGRDAKEDAYVPPG